jgi:hypothetical protein
VKVKSFALEILVLLKLDKMFSYHSLSPGFYSWTDR